MYNVLAFSVILTQFQPVTLFEVDRVLDYSGATIGSLAPCLAGLIKASKPIMTEWATSIINMSFLEGRVPQALKETLIRPMCKKSNLVVDNINNYRPITNIPF